MLSQPVWFLTEDSLAELSHCHRHPQQDPASSVKGSSKATEPNFNRKLGHFTNSQVFIFFPNKNEWTAYSQLQGEGEDSTFIEVLLCVWPFPDITL